MAVLDAQPGSLFRCQQRVTWMTTFRFAVRWCTGRDALETALGEPMTRFCAVGEAHRSASFDEIGAPHPPLLARLQRMRQRICCRSDHDGCGWQLRGCCAVSGPTAAACP